MGYTRPTPDRFDILRNRLPESGRRSECRPGWIFTSHAADDWRLSASAASASPIRGVRAGDGRLVGRRMPDIECDGTRLYEVLRSGRFVLVTAAGTGSIAVDWPGVDYVVHADRTLPAAMPVRPGGYIAWATHRPPVATQLLAVMSRWCGQRTKDQCAVR